MSEQLPLRYDARWLNSEAWALVLIEAQRVLGDVGLKQAAYDLDVPPSMLAHAIAERDRHYLRGEWLLYFVAKDAEDGRLADAIAKAGGRETKPIGVLTDDVFRARVEALMTTDPAIGALLRMKAGLR